MASYGYTLSSEEWGPRDLVAAARRAEEVGFDFCSISDHFHPWIDDQGHSPFVWGVLGAVAEATSTIEVGIGVTCPTVRIHPAIIAPAVATADLLFEGRLRFGVGTGEALNEHILGHRWPPAEVRLEMLEESLEVMRALWTGDEVDHHGTTTGSRTPASTTRPARPGGHRVGLRAQGRRVAARIGDGLWSTAPDPELLDSYAEAGGEGPRYGQMSVCYGPDEEACRRTVAEVWPNAGFAGELAQELPTPAHRRPGRVAPHRAPRRLDDLWPAPSCKRLLPRGMRTGPPFPPPPPSSSPPRTRRPSSRSGRPSSPTGCGT